jgi:hypothetical protein
MILTEPVVQGTNVGQPRQAGAAGRVLVVGQPQGDGLRPGVGGFGFVFASVRAALAAQVVADGGLRNPEGLGNLGVGLPLAFEDGERPAPLSSEPGRPGRRKSCGFRRGSDGFRLSINNSAESR